MEVDPHNNVGWASARRAAPAALLQFRNQVLGPSETIKTLKDYVESAAN